MLVHLWSDGAHIVKQQLYIFAPSVVVLLLIYEFLYFIFKYPSTTIKSELDSARLSRVTSKLSVNFSNLSLVWLGDW